MGRSHERPTPAPGMDVASSPARREQGVVAICQLSNQVRGRERQTRGAANGIEWEGRGKGGLAECDARAAESPRYSESIGRFPSAYGPF